MKAISLVSGTTAVSVKDVQLIDALGRNAIYVANGIPAGARPLTIIPAADFKRALEHHSKDEIKVVIEWA